MKFMAQNVYDDRALLNGINGLCSGMTVLVVLSNVFDERNREKLKLG